MDYPDFESLATAGYYILRHSSNRRESSDYRTVLNKEWARRNKPIANLVVHTGVGPDGVVYANFDEGFLPLYHDDTLRMSEPCEDANVRQWRFETEADCENWFHAEVSNIVMAAWTAYPTVMQLSQSKPPTAGPIPETADIVYSTKIGNTKHILAVGEIKKSVIDRGAWQSGQLPAGGEQQRLSQELRQYARRYQCPQVFCFDGETLLVLQFRVATLEAIDEANCRVDCWVIPVRNSTTTLRYALYRLLTQGWRRCQGVMAEEITVDGITSAYREFYNGRPIWRVDGVNTALHPHGYERSVDASTGAFKWRLSPYPDVFETLPLWHSQ